MLVVDASVAVKLLANEPDSETAVTEVLADEERIAPDWVMLEVANALWKKVERGELDQHAAVEGLAALPRFLTRLEPSISLLDDAVDLMVRLRHAPYDCLYLALALRERGRVLTADQSFARACDRGGYANAVAVLGA